MRRRTVGKSLQWIVLAACSILVTHSATAASFTRQCAARDLQVLMLIEQQEATNAVSTRELRDAVFALLDARIVCYEGHVLDALAIYDRIAQSITPNPALSGRPPPAEIQ